MKKPLERKGLDRLLMPANLFDLGTYTAVKNVTSSIFTSIIFAWVANLSLGIPAGTRVFEMFTVCAIVCFLAMRIGYHKFARISYVICTSVSYICWSQIFGPYSYLWLFPISGFIGGSFQTAPTEKKMLLGFQILDVSTFVICIGLYIVDPPTVAYSAEIQGRILKLGMAIILYVFFILYKAIVLYRREVLLSRKQLETQAVSMLQQAKMSSLGEMAGGVAHEINNPLAMIMGNMTQILRDLNSDSFDRNKLSEKGKKILNTVERIAKIVTALRTFSREADDDPFQKAHLADIVEDTMNLCGEKLSAASIERKITIDPSLYLDCRASQISQVLVSLINNSIDAVVRLPEKWIEIKSENLGHLLRIIVTDSGQGIPKDIANKIMQPFFTTKEIGKGPGLGLSVSKGIIEGHGGSIQLDSTCSNTRFVIELPVHQVAPSDSKNSSAAA